MTFVLPRPPPMDDWERTLVAELNGTIDIDALSRDVPRLKIRAAPHHRVAPTAATAEATATKSASSLLDSGAASERADRMCAALLQIEELCGVASPPTAGVVTGGALFAAGCAGLFRAGNGRLSADAAEASPGGIRV